MAEQIFVYGTLRRELGHPMHRLLAQHARYVGRASFAGRLYDLNGYPGAVPDPAGRGRVWGEVYRFSAPGPLLALLDRYEGCNNNANAGSSGGKRGGPQDEYRRELRTVYGENGERLRAWIYLYNRPVGGRREIPGGDYLEALRGQAAPGGAKHRGG